MNNIGELGEFGIAAVGPGGYVSAATIGAVIGFALPGIGPILGAALGGAIDVWLGARANKEALKAMKKAFYVKLLKRYNTQIFISALERMGPAMVYVAALGLKPGTPEYTNLLIRKLRAEIGYKGECAIDLLGPASPGQPRPLIASIDKIGRMQAHSPHIDTSLGKSWAQACKEMHLAALKSWAEDESENILLKRSVIEEREAAKRGAITRISINAGIIMLIIGYTIRQKRKLAN